jgi:hypothetical protein
MSKKDRKRQQPNIAPAAVLRARLEGAWLAAQAAEQTPEQLLAVLAAASRDHKPDLITGGVLPIYAAAQPAVQAKLAQVAPAWLAQQDDLRALEALVSHAQLPEALLVIAQQWLAAAGRAVTPLTLGGADAFHSAYALDNQFQSAVSLLWYSNPQRTRARGMQFLIDHAAPWNGAVKDVMLFPNKPAEKLIERYVTSWAERGQAMRPIAAAEVKRRLVTALKANEAEGIRLPRDLIALREAFVSYVLPLPEARRTPAFTAADFERLSVTGDPPEKLSAVERALGMPLPLDSVELEALRKLDMGEDEAGRSE